MVSLTKGPDAVHLWRFKAALVKQLPPGTAAGALITSSQ
jgi:hypothetical protein